MDLNSHFVHMFSDGLRMVNGQEEGAVIRVVEVGNVVLVSGAIVTCDPIYISGSHEPYSLHVTPGSYPAELSVVTYTKTGLQQVVGARVIFGDELPTSWQLALCPTDPNKGDELYGYLVDSGTGCFVDFTLLSHLEYKEPTDVNPFWEGAVITPEILERLMHAQSDKEVQEIALALSAQGIAPSPQEQESVVKRIIQKLLESEQEGWSWANFVLDSSTGGNVVIFSSGPGDGVYPSFFGLDAHGTPLCLVTDFQLLEGAREKP